MRSSPPRAARSRPSRGTAPPAPSSAPARPWRAARAHPVTDFQPFNYRVALRSEAIPVCVAWPNASPAAGAAHAAAGGAHADPRRAAPTCARRSRTPRSVAARIPGAAARRRAVHRPLGRHQRPQRTARKNAIAAFFAGRRSRSAPTAPQIIPPSPIAPTRLSRVRGRTKALKTVAAVTATVRDVRLQFLGDEIAAGRATPVGAKVARPALRATRRRPRAATTCAASSSSPASSVNGFVPTAARHRDAHHQRRARPRTAS